MDINLINFGVNFLLFIDFLHLTTNSYDHSTIQMKPPWLFLTQYYVHY